MTIRCGVLILCILSALVFQLDAQIIFVDGISLSNEYVRDVGLIDMEAWGVDYTGSVRGLGISLGQLVGIDPETGDVITNTMNMLPVLPRPMDMTDPANRRFALSAQQIIITSATMVVDYSGSNVSFNVRQGSLTTNEIDTVSLDARYIVVTNPSPVGDLDMNGYAITNASGITLSGELRTNWPTFSETDPVYTNDLANGLLATGTPVYVETDPVWFSEKSGYATGTPLYAYTETDPVWGSASNLYYLQTQADALFSTGTPIYVESDPVWTSEKSGYATGTPLYAYTETDPNALLANGTRAMSGNINMNNHRIINLTDPTLGTDAATKDYVDANSGPDEISALSSSFTVAGGENVSSGAVVTLVNGEVVPLGRVIGAETVFASNSVFSCYSIALSESNIVTVFRDASNGGVGAAVAGVIDNHQITWGDITVFSANSVAPYDVTVLDQSYFVIGYVDFDNANVGAAILGFVDDVNITFGNESIFSANTTESIALDAISTNHVLITYCDFDNSLGQAVVGIVEDPDIVFSDATNFNADVSLDTSVSMLTTDRCVLAFRDENDGMQGVVIPGVIDGTNVTFGSEVVFDSDPCGWICVEGMDDNLFTLLYNNENDWFGYSVVGVITNDTLYIGEDVLFAPSNSGFYALGRLDESHPVAVFNDYEDGQSGKYVSGTLTGTNLS